MVIKNIMHKIVKKILTKVLIILVFYPGLVFSETGKRPAPDSVIKGKVLYEKHCQTCHKKDGVGEIPMPWSVRQPDYVEAMPLDDSSHAWHHSDEQLVNTILEGTRSTKRMPAWKGTLSKKDAQNLVAYLKSLWSDKSIACQGPKHMDC